MEAATGGGSISELLAHMESLLEDLKRRGDANRHFLGIYLGMTRAVQDELESGRLGGFLDPAWVEHWDVAIEQGKHVARAMQGSGDAYTVVPYFFSDLADWASLEYAGIGGEAEVEDVRGDMDSGSWSITYGAADGRVLGCLAVERSDDVEAAKQRISAQA